MNLSRLYANTPEMFAPVDFVPGLNITMGETRLPENRNKGSCSLGKAALGQVVDYAFLNREGQRFCPIEHIHLFKDCVFFLEIQLEGNTFAAIRRGAEAAGKITIKRHEAGRQDFSGLSSSEWDQQNVSVGGARAIHGGLPDWRPVKPWGCRMELGWLLRSQEDFGSVFQLGRHMPKQFGWTPYIAHILGFNAALVSECRKMGEELKKSGPRRKLLKKSWPAHLGKSATSKAFFFSSQKAPRRSRRC
jgi:uncharacterized protein YydD (DUF2326 family)